MQSSAYIWPPIPTATSPMYLSMCTYYCILLYLQFNISFISAAAPLVWPTFLFPGSGCINRASLYVAMLMIMSILIATDEVYIYQFVVTKQFRLQFNAIHTWIAVPF